MERTDYRRDGPRGGYRDYDDDRRGPRSDEPPRRAPRDDDRRGLRSDEPPRRAPARHYDDHDPPSRKYDYDDEPPKRQQRNYDDEREPQRRPRYDDEPAPRPQSKLTPRRSPSYETSSEDESPERRPILATGGMTAVDMFRKARIEQNGGVEPEEDVRRREKKAAKAAQKAQRDEARSQATGRLAPSARMGGGGSQSDYMFKGDERREEGYHHQQFSNKYTDIEHEDPDLTQELFGNHSNTGINFSKYKNIAVSVEGKNVPKSIQRFQEVQLPRVLIENLKLAQWDVPTPIQQHALPIGFAGRDIMGCAQTGSGKTAAFLFPIINLLLQKHQPKRSGTPAMPGALIIVPTRELAQQISIEAIKFTYRSPLKSVVVYGGSGTKRDQYQALRTGCDILIGTPGRLIDFLSGGAIALNNISFLCLDEADRMLDMGFEPQMNQILKGCPTLEKRQTLMFSATFPHEIQQLAKRYLRPDHVFIAVGRVGAAVAEIKQQIFFVEEVKKFDELVVLLKAHPLKTLIFTKTKINADMVSDRLRRMGVPCGAIHGDKEQAQREEALGKFKTGILKVLVATDVASRGLDIPEVGHVINYDLPQNIDDYTHRIGRTGRIGQPGLASSFYNDGNNMIKRDLQKSLRDARQEVPPFLEWDRKAKGF